MKKTSFDRRKFLGGVGVASLFALSGCAGETEFQGKKADAVWQERVTQLENYTRLGYGEFSTANPGKWTGKEATHVPMVQQSGYTVQAYVTHPMDVDHWITTIYAKDQGGKIIYLKEFIPNAVESDKEPEYPAIDFDVPVGTTSFTVYAFCNKHDNWITDTFTV
jgi:desulfoferrodoxin (superoxide reductase-like protein)